MLTDIPPLIKHFADTKNLLINAVDAVGQLSKYADQYLSEARRTCTPTCSRCNARCVNWAVPGRT